jgi:predicted alpha/beta superfamily hydrolase
MPITQANYERKIRVFYPLAKGSMVLRTAGDWDHNIEPESVSDDKTVFEFTVAAERPFLYFKPCIIDGCRIHWSAGMNNLAVLSEPGSRDIYPFFHSPQVGVIEPILEFDSALLARPHQLRVYLPAGYEENTLKRYPVLYMHDAKNLFFPEEAFLGRDWEVDKTLELLEAMNVIDRLIVVGIYAVNREEEYTKPGYEKYGRSVVSEVKPLIDSRFRSLPGPAHTGVMGSSLGGVASFFMAWEWPDVFGRAVCMSSSFTIGDDLIDRVIAEPQRDIKIYLDSGWPGDNYEVTLSMCMALIERGYVFGRDFLYFVFPLAGHDETSWGARCHLPLQLFSGEAINAALQSRIQFSSAKGASAERWKSNTVQSPSDSANT